MEKTLKCFNGGRGKGGDLEETWELGGNLEENLEGGGNGSKQIKLRKWLQLFGGETLPIWK